MANGTSLSRLYRRRQTVPGMKEGIREPLYDFLTVASGVTSALRFFQVPEGGGAGKTLIDTNMQLSGQLPRGWKFACEIIEVHVQPGSDADAYVRQDPVQYAGAPAAPEFANDVWALVSRAFLRFTIGSKPYLTAPLLAFPSATGLHVNATAAVSDSTADTAHALSVDYARLAGHLFVVNPVLMLEGGSGFAVTIDWGGAVTTPSGFDARIGVLLRGVTFRDV